MRKTIGFDTPEIVCSSSSTISRFIMNLTLGLNLLPSVEVPSLFIVKKATTYIDIILMIVNKNFCLFEF